MTEGTGGGDSYRGGGVIDEEKGFSRHRGASKAKTERGVCRGGNGTTCMTNTPDGSRGGGPA